MRSILGAIELAGPIVSVGILADASAYITVRNSAAFVGHVFNVPAGVWARYKRAPQTAAADSRTAI